MKIFDFNATWCGPCRMMKPIFEETSNESDVKEKNIDFYSVDVEDENDIPGLNLKGDDAKYTGLDLAAKFGIRNIPAFIKTDDELNVVDRLVGAVPKSKFKEWVLSAGNDVKKDDK